MSETLLEELKASQQLVVAMTQLVAEDAPARVGGIGRPSDASTRSASRDSNSPRPTSLISNGSPR